MTKSKSTYKWLYLLIGIVVLIWSFSEFNKYDEEFTELTNLKIELNNDVENIKGRRNKADYRFYSKKNKARFQILDGAINRGYRKHISNLKKGQIVDIKINKSDINNLNSNKDINVYSIKAENRSLLSIKDYKSNRKKYANRLNVLFMFMGFLAILKGLNMSNKQRLIFFFGGIAIFLIFRIFDIGY